jgi:hypothetical protein
MSSTRLVVNYKNTSDQFYRRDQDFKRQFCHIYSSRLKRLGHELLEEKSKQKFGKSIIDLFTVFIILTNLFAIFR